MFELKNFIKVPDSSYGFVDIEDRNKIQEMKNRLDKVDLEGAIELKYYGETILDRNNWDIIDLLWIYIMELIEGCVRKTESSINFPDSPVTLSLKNINKNDVLLTVSALKVKRYALPRIEFYTFMLVEAEYFLSKLKEYFDDQYEIYVLNESIIRLRNIV